MESSFGHNPRDYDVRTMRLFSLLFLRLLALGSLLTPGLSRLTAQSPEEPPEPAIPAILHAFDSYEVVAMPAAHGAKDIDDLILMLVRDPRFPAAVKDIVVDRQQTSPAKGKVALRCRQLAEGNWLPAR